MKLICYWLEICVLPAGLGTGERKGIGGPNLLWRPPAITSCLFGYRSGTNPKQYSRNDQPAFFSRTNLKLEISSCGQFCFFTPSTVERKEAINMSLELRTDGRRSLGLPMLALAT